MTNAEEAELRGEIYGLKILLVNCLTTISSTHVDRTAYLNSVRDQAIAGIAQAAPAAIKPAYLQTFQGAAAGVVTQAVQAAMATPAELSSRR